MTHQEALAKCGREVARRGYRVSAGSWSEYGYALAFSIESGGPAVYGHPNCEIMARDYGDGKGWRFTYRNQYIEVE